MAQKKAIEKQQNSGKATIDGLGEKSHIPMLAQNRAEPHPYGGNYNIKIATPINFVDNISIQGVEQLKFFKRLDKQIERQKKLYDFYVQSGGNPLLKDEEMRQRCTLDPYRPVNNNTTACASSHQLLNKAVS